MPRAAGGECGCGVQVYQLQPHKLQALSCELAQAVGAEQMQSTVAGLSARVVAAVHSLAAGAEPWQLAQVSGWEDLLAALAPIVISTPELAAQMLSSDEHSFDTVVLDNAHLMGAHEAVAHLGCLAEGGRLLAVSSKLNKRSAYHQLQQLTDCPAVEFSGRYAMPEGIPVPHSVQHALGGATIHSNPSWKQQRLPNNLSAAQQAVQKAHGTQLTAEQASVVGDELRGIRGGLVNTAEAAAVIAKACELTDAMPWANVSVVAPTLAQACLLKALSVLCGNRRIHAMQATELCAASCDVLLLSLTHRSGRSRMSSECARAVCQLLEHGARLRVLVYMSGELSAWSSRSPQSAFGQIGQALKQLKQHTCNQATETDAPEWLNQVHSRLQVT